VGRSGAKSERSEDFRSSEMLGGGEVAQATSRRPISLASSRPLGEMRAQRASRLTATLTGRAGHQDHFESTDPVTFESACLTARA